MPQRGKCQLCRREQLELTRHHLIPKMRHNKGSARRAFARPEMRTRLALLCRACHSFVHKTLSEKELESGFATLEQLAQHPEIGRFSRWLSTKPPGYSPRSRRPRG